MTEQPGRRAATIHLSTLRTLRVMLPAVILAGLSAGSTMGQVPTPTFSIDDVAVTEGNGGTSLATLTVRLANPNGVESRVSFSVSDGTATSGERTATFFSGPITIGDSGAASPYPASINVSGLTGFPHSVALAVNGLTHPTPDDVDILLVGPGGESIIAQSDAGGRSAVTNVNYLLDDLGTPMPTPLSAGVFRPFNAGADDPFPAPAPGGPHANPAPAGPATLGGTFRFREANGTWRVYVADDTAGNPGAIRSLTLITRVPDPGSDYLSTGGQLVFPPGTTSLPVTVTILGDTTVEPNETFFVDLVGAVNGVIGDGHGVGTIVNDDGGGGTRPTAVDDGYLTVANAPSFGAGAAAGVLTNDNSNGGGPMTATLVSTTTHGTLTFRPDGGFTYVVNPDFVGTDTFTYRAVNASGESNLATVSIVVQSPTNAQSPRRLRVDEVVGNQVTVRFDSPLLGPAPTQFGLAGGLLPGQTLAFLPTGSTDPIYSFAAPNGSFLIRTHTLVGADQSAPSNEVPLHVTTAVPPSAPENLLGLIDGSALTLTWKNTFGGGVPTNVILNVSGDATLSVPLGLTETFSYRLVPAGSYTFTVAAANAAGLSGLSNPVPLNFPGLCSGPPEMPGDFLFYRRGNRAQAIWAAALRGAAAQDFLVDIISPIFTGTVPVTERSIGAAVPSGDYSLRVAGRNSCGTGPWTAFQRVNVP